MGKTFQEQMLALGLVDKKKAKSIKKEKHQSRTKKGKKGGGAEEPSVVDENIRLAKEAEEKKKQRAKQLNREREAKLQKRADNARIKQLVEQHRIEQDPNGTPYRFNCAGKIQRIFVDKTVADKLSKGLVAIVGVGEQFDLVPKEIAARLSEISKDLFIHRVEDISDSSTDEDDPYAEYKIPDDLTW